MTPPVPPLWLLDVDGVLNAVTRNPDPNVWGDWKSGWATANGREWPIHWSPTVTGTIRDLHEIGKVEVRWLTTWRGQANGDLRELLGLPELLVAGETDRAANVVIPEPETVHTAPGEEYHGAMYTGSRGEWWKFEVVRRVVAAEPGRTIIWSDDDLMYEKEARTWVQTNVPSRLLLVPQPHLGLTPKLLQQVKDLVGE